MADIDEHIGHGPGGSVFMSQTIRSNGPRRSVPRSNPRSPIGQDDDNPDEVLRNFQHMLSNFMGTGFRHGPPGRSGHDELFAPPMGGAFRVNGGPIRRSGVIGGRFTYTTTRYPRAGDEPQGQPDITTYASPPSPHSNGRSLYIVSMSAPPDRIASLLGSILSQLGDSPGQPGDHEARGGMPLGLPGLFASLLNPANARQGDAVYSQEALDQIISNLMEQHPTSNAPGPASPDAIAALPKINLNETILGPEGKGECSVCMDDVHIGDEVVMLPCNHWFHEACAGAWLGEHNTCPICRHGIEAETPPSNSRRSSQTGQSSPPRPDYRSQRLGLSSRSNNRDVTVSRNEARLDSIRNSGRLTPTEESGPRRWQIVGESSRPRPDPMADYLSQMPGTFPSPRRQDSEMSETQRDSRRGNASGSDHSRESHRSSQSGSSGTGNGGIGSWIRDRFSGSGNDRRRD
jgi:E3 ubiquitin-protein ligase RNF115/126